MNRHWTTLAVALALAAAPGCGGSNNNTGGGGDSAAPDGSVDASVDMGTTPDAAPDRPDAPTGPSRAGAACANDMACGGGVLECDLDFRGGFCTAECMNNRQQSNEQMQCGGTGSTCLSLGDGADAVSFCTSTCTPTARAGMPGACRAGTICTGWWYTHEGATPDRTGCEYFCHNDNECTMGERCNTRTGECGQAFVATRRQDGEPCDPSMESGDPPMNTQCRGICFQETDNPREGICGSVVDLGVATMCPDAPMRVQPLAPGDKNGRLDNLGLCIYRSCTTDADCMSPLRCVADDEGERYCGYGMGVPADGGVDAAADAPRPDAAADASADAPRPDATTDAPRADVPTG